MTLKQPSYIKMMLHTLQKIVWISAMRTILIVILILLLIGAFPSWPVEASHTR